jgi:hypothetical protein
LRKQLKGFQFIKDTDAHMAKKMRRCLDHMKEQPTKLFTYDELIPAIGYKNGLADKKAAQVVLYRLKAKGLIRTVNDLYECPATKMRNSRIEQSPAIQQWLKRLRSKETKEKFLYLFLKFVDWVKQKGYFDSADAMLVHKQDARTDKDRYQHINMAEDYLLECPLKAGQKKSTYTAIRSFYKHNKAELPSYPIQFTDQTITPVTIQQPITLDEVRQLLANAEPREKAIFLCLLQSGMDRSTLAEYFNLHCWQQIAQQLGSEDPANWDLSKCPIRIDLC